MLPWRVMIMKLDINAKKGIEKAKAEGKYQCRQPNLALHHDILDQLTLGLLFADSREVRL